MLTFLLVLWAQSGRSNILVVLVFLSLACAKDMSTHTQTHEHIFLQVQFGMVLNKYVAAGLYCYILAHPPC